MYNSILCPEIVIVVAINIVRDLGDTYVRVASMYIYVRYRCKFLIHLISVFHYEQHTLVYLRDI
jgi:hypothetical protein